MLHWSWQLEALLIKSEIAEGRLLSAMSRWASDALPQNEVRNWAQMQTNSSETYQRSSLLSQKGRSLMLQTWLVTCLCAWTCGWSNRHHDCPPAMQAGQDSSASQNTFILGQICYTHAWAVCKQQSGDVDTAHWMWQSMQHIVYKQQNQVSEAGQYRDSWPSWPMDSDQG